MDAIAGLLFLFTLFALYMLPGMVASARHHANVNAIVALNLLLGWTFIGWVVALVWALTAQGRAHFHN